MPVAAFTIGSVGDIALVLELLSQLRAALSGATGVPVELQQLVRDVAAFARELREVADFLLPRATYLRQDVCNGIVLALDICYRTLHAMQTKVVKFQSRVTRNIGRLAWRDYWSVAAWSILGGRREVDALRLRLSEQLRIIQTYMALSQCHSGAELSGMAHSHGQKLNQILAVIRGIDSFLDAGTPSFQFYDSASNMHYQPCARTSLQASYHLYLTYTHRPFEVDFEAPNVTYRKVWLIPEEPDFLVRPPLAVDCVFFREQAFGEIQVLLGLGSARGNTEAGDTLKLIVNRKHTIGAKCDCDAGRCGGLYAADARSCALWADCADCYTAVASAVLAGITSPSGIEADGNVFQDLSRALFQFPNPGYIRVNVLPILEAPADPPINEVLALMKGAPKLEHQPPFPRGILWTKRAA
ncbi:hypothetical protein AURDEDRAFT_172915 [Auricularia subglabra TFB-10046 SS5]|nr:hypothetical protein AURDEDRAFT_172915 [Auricularia subglabra TFB-10046 SS5]